MLYAMTNGNNERVFSSYGACCKPSNSPLVYIPRPDGVSTVRILHAARDWWSLLDVEI